MIEPVPNWLQLRRIIAVLCVAALLLAAVAPAGSGLLFATLVTIALLTIACVCVAMPYRGERFSALRLVFLSPVTGRAPPSK
jgi:uncharacterized membrane protein